MLEVRVIGSKDVPDRRPYLYYLMRRYGAFETLARHRDIFVYPVVNLISVWFQGGNPFPELSPSDIARLRSPDALLICDYSGDAHPLGGPVFDTLSLWADANEINLDRLIIMSQNPVGQRQAFDHWAAQRRPTKRLRFGFAHSWLDWTASVASSISTKTVMDGIVAKKTHRFLSLNNAPRTHRVMLVALMHKLAPSDCLTSLGLSKSWRGPNSPENRPYAGKPTSWLMTRCEASKSFMDAWGWLVSDLDIPSVVRDCNLPSPKGPVMWEFDEGEYARSLISLVGETEMSRGDFVRFSEKSIKPPLFGHPFLIAGNTASLRMLRRFGMQTFPELFDETYDAMADPVERLSHLMLEVSRICTMPFSDLQDRVSSVREKVISNFDYCQRQLRLNYREWLCRHLTDLIEGSSGVKNFMSIGPFKDQN